jgi:hypothetical protein
MPRFVILLVTVLVGSLVSASGPDGDCVTAGWGGNCSVENTGSTVDIGASLTQPGRGGSGGDRGGGGNGGGGGSVDNGTTAPTEPEDCGLCRGNYEVVLLLRDVTVADVESFAPGASPIRGEPAGVGIVGMPVNFVVTADTHTVGGTLFDLPVSVRFVPASFAFDYGDGSGRESTTGGSSWSTLGQAQFTPTATSHSYSARGTYSTRAVVRYSAAVDFGNGWIPVPGYVERPTGAASVEVVEVRTALVDRTCLEDPTGPGC